MLCWGVQAYFMKSANNHMSAEGIFFYMMIAGLLLVPVAWLLTDRSQPINWGWSGPGLAAGIQVLNAIGALTLAASDPDAFDDDEAALLVQLASDLAYGIGALRNRTALRIAEQRSREHAARLEALWKIINNPRLTGEGAGAGFHRRRPPQRINQASPRTGSAIVAVTRRTSSSGACSQATQNRTYMPAASRASALTTCPADQSSTPMAPFNVMRADSSAARRCESAPPARPAPPAARRPRRMA